MSQFAKDINSNNAKGDNKKNNIKFTLGNLIITSRGARDSKIGKKWPESSRILDYILS